MKSAIFTSTDTLSDLALLRTKPREGAKAPRLPKAPRDLTKHTRIVTLWSRQWRQRNATDQDIWTYITMRWPTLLQSEKQTIFKEVTGKTYSHNVLVKDRSVLINKHRRMFP